MLNEDWQIRTRLLLGDEQVQKLNQAHVLVVGLGGVGGVCAEFLVRAGIGKLTVADGDLVHPSNLNRQLPALRDALGLPKTVVLAQRLQRINPEIELEVVQEYLQDDILRDIVHQPYDYVVDAIDTLSPKVFLVYESMKAGHKLVSSMGAGGKMDPALIRTGDISESNHCRLAYYLRKKLHRLGIYHGFKVVYSPEEIPEHSKKIVPDEKNKKTIVGTISYMPGIFGGYCASVVIRDLISQQVS
jgi:tRNA A37 threonylcarbamoyladenosine dehydratase